jgi:hypothetical protein
MEQTLRLLVAAGVLYAVYLYMKGKGLVPTTPPGGGSPPPGGANCCSQPATGNMDLMTAVNPNFTQQMLEWKSARRARGENPCDWQAFRTHLVAIGAPDPGPNPPPAFCQG